MKTLNSILILITLVAVSIYAVTFTGCNNNPLTSSTGTTSKTYQTRTEAEFKSNPNLKAEWGDLIVLNLEDLHSPVNDTIPDLDIIGEDMVPIVFSDTVTQQIAMEDSTSYKVKLVKESGEIVFELTPENSQANVTIFPGNYKMYVTSLEEFSVDHSGRQTVFINPDTTDANANNRNGGQNNVSYVRYVFHQDCPGCNLSNKDFYDYDFTARKYRPSFMVVGRNFAGANFSNSNLQYTNFSSANFQNANFRSANLKGSNCKGANFRETDLSYANFNKIGEWPSDFRNTDMRLALMHRASLIGADLTSSNLQQSYMFYTNFRNANLTNADLRYAMDMRGAIYCGAIKTGIQGPQFGQDGTQCWP